MQLCPRCGSVNADGAVVCSCGRQLSSTVARIHPQPARADDGRIRELQLASRRDLQWGLALTGILSCFAIVLFGLFGRAPRWLVWVGLFWGVIRIFRGFRLRREAWELEHLGFIQRERDTARG
jgi:hypothetical protein